MIGGIGKPKLGSAEAGMAEPAKMAEPAMAKVQTSNCRKAAESTLES